MILLKFYLAIFAIFISPQIFTYYKFNKLPYSLTLIAGFIISLSSVWFLTFISYFLNLPNSLFFAFALLVSIYSIYYLIKNFKSREDENYFIYWLIAIVLLLPIFKYGGYSFNQWDALVSWHRWGLELYNNEYHPIDAAYPILVPSLYSIIYKVEGISDIWWSAKLILYIFPLFSLIIPLILYKESKNIIFLLMIIFLYPYILMPRTLYGDVDMPLMLMGIITLYSLLATEIHKDNKLFDYYLYSSLLLAGLTSITKQGGIIFMIFTTVYILVNFKRVKNRKKVFYFWIGMLLYFATFLILYKLNAYKGVTGNINDLKELSSNTFKNIYALYDKFFYYPFDLPIFETLKSALKINYTIPFILIFSIVIYILELLLNVSKKFKLLAFLAILFSIIGFIGWAKVASYHPRNSLFVKSFLILFISISIYYVINIFIKYKKIKLYISIISILSIGYIFLIISDNYVYKRELSLRYNLGDPNVAMFLSREFNKSKCLKLYTSDYATTYNYYLSKYKSRIDSDDFIDNSKFLISAINNNCKDGSYILARASDPTYSSWSWFNKLLKDKIIEKTKISPLLFWSPPNKKVSNDYFEEKTDFANIKIQKYDKNIKYNIEDIKKYNNIYLIEGWAFLKDKNLTTQKKFIVLDNKNSKYIINTISLKRNDVVKVFKIRNYYSGFKAYIFKKDLKKRDYHIKILIIDNLNKTHLIDTNRVLKL